HRPCTLSSCATPSTDLYSLSLHDALPIYTARAARLDAARGAGLGDRALARHDRRAGRAHARPGDRRQLGLPRPGELPGRPDPRRSEEHTSELQSRENLVCRLLLEKKNVTL